ncbi:hypothetical protein C7T35_03055 [Variovorax sp. WS11]|uniref:hypothetical protein n=1 Tax=Variovorax sp. WS11 TaxID=1105204 RepID=UPI000D0D8415|nr:hypothetical protein [Variovorax sp. WS11]NDZ17475.1 hypothetical protein [Variovorax sp. WS11]PSL85990.1 hypothetical protein C7T35_03055 [Variovorax sp. WS11]
MNSTFTLNTADALTRMHIPPTFDVTEWPRQVERFLQKTQKPLHRAILKNYFRHLLLEVSGYWDQIIVPALTIDEPMYRVGDRREMRVLSGKAAVQGFYREAFETRQNVMGARTMNMGVEDYGVTTEAVWTHVVPGACLKDHDIDANPGAHYLMSHHLFQIFTYTNDVEPKLIAERIYDDPESYSYEKLDPSDVVTPEMAREQLAPFLARATLD